MKDTNDDRRNRFNGGFTLIEVLLVVAIIGMLAAIGILTLPGRQKKAMISATRGKIDNICTALDVYEIDTGQFPSSLQSLIQDDGSPNWQGPYIKGGLPADPWGTPIQYTRKSDTSYEVKSAGPDMQLGNEDDITSF